MSEINVAKETIKLYAKQLKLPTFSQYTSIIRRMDSNMGYEEFLIELMKKEVASRQENQQKRRIHKAGFPYLKTLDEFDYTRLKYVEQAFIWELATCEFISKRQNVIMIGNTGTGKTHISIGLGLKACKEGYNVKFYTVANLVTELTEAQEYKKLLKLEKQLEKVDLLILDELSYLCFNRNQADLLFRIISDRSEKGSVIVSTNLEFSRWTEMFDNTTMVAALVDRLTFRSHVLNMNGESFRRDNSQIE
ncbi:IS21-like element helper ATPase IstB [Thermoanaerobacterium saccharolyticum]|uniref:IstB domain protein ATP-binding protein n=4 Tax=Thermoanaerobacterium TaxID=28895 RepID=I3VTL9_THESW|nr:IS21-like element helper ATPase IstB [Thermoanaerobacterium saccharolyticum]AFK85864.1 IstB domain protein ATP-binding protein [Thermoanaerobacterium saccharolyticum JW/SL-YS485]